MSNRGLLAAALLKDELTTSDERINTALFAAAFAELDEMRTRIAEIPKEIDASAANFRKVNVQAVDDFVAVANEALSKFMLRTGEMKDALGLVEKRVGELSKSRPGGGQIVTQAPPARSSGGSSVLNLSLAFGGGLFVATAICLAVFLVIGGGSA